MATTVYTTLPINTPERRTAAMENLRLMGEAFEAGHGDYNNIAGVQFVSAIIGDDGVMTVTLTGPLPDYELPQYSFI